MDGATHIFAIATCPELTIHVGRACAAGFRPRFESREEYKLAVQWRETFAHELAPYYSNWAVRETISKDLVERTTIPYLSYWSFGEQLPNVDETTRAPEFISYYVETLAALAAHRLTKSDLLVESTDSYVSGAAREGPRSGRYAYNGFISYAHQDPKAVKTAEELAELLSHSGVRVFLNRWLMTPGGSSWSMSNATAASATAAST